MKIGLVARCLNTAHVRGMGKYVMELLRHSDDDIAWHLFADDPRHPLLYPPGARFTPDIFVFDATRTLRYNGRCDDNWREPARVTRRDLRAALDRLLAGQQIDFDVHPALGCSIKWKT